MSRIVLATIALALFASGCGKREPDTTPKPKVDAAAEQAAAHDRAAKGPFSADIKAYDTAKGLEADINKKAQDNLDTVDKMSK